MKSASFYFLVFLLCGYLLSCSESGNSGDGKLVTNEKPMSKAELIKHGKYMVTIMGCADCHTPKKMTERGPVVDETRWLMGYPKDQPLPQIDKTEIEPGKWVLFSQDLMAAVGPWGVSFSANITPHESGIGNWTYDHFKKALTEGKHKGLDNGRMIMPPMPWESFTQIKEEDLMSIFTYLKSIKPIDNVVPAYIPPPNM